MVEEVRSGVDQRGGSASGWRVGAVGCNTINDSLWRSADPAPKESPGGDHALSTTGDGRWDNQHAMPSTDAPYESNTVVKLQIPMGTWMGFHDREPPLMAKVAVRDLEKDSYIFTNREGIKLRELTVAQLIALIDRDMVDILERKTNFRETVNQMRRDQERLANA